MTIMMGITKYKKDFLNVNEQVVKNQISILENSNKWKPELLHLIKQVLIFDPEYRTITLPEIKRSLLSVIYFKPLLIKIYYLT